MNMIQRFILITSSLIWGVFFVAITTAKAAEMALQPTVIETPPAYSGARLLHKPIVVLASKTYNIWDDIERSLSLMKFEIIKTSDLSGLPSALNDKPYAIIFDCNSYNDAQVQEVLSNTVRNLQQQYGAAVRMFWVETSSPAADRENTGQGAERPGNWLTRHFWGPRWSPHFGAAAQNAQDQAQQQHPLDPSQQPPAWASPLPITTFAGIEAHTIYLTLPSPSPASSPGEDVRLEILKEYSREWEKSLSFTVMSFPVKLGFLPKTADVVFDARDLRDPYFVDALREPDGRSAEVQNYIAADPLTEPYWSAYVQQSLPIFMYRLFETTLLNGKDKQEITIAFGCSGGHHRSVFCAERLGNWLITHQRKVSIRHLGLELAGTAKAPVGAESARELLRIPNDV
jgi:hypothetical protein